MGARVEADYPRRLLVVVAAEQQAAVEPEARNGSRGQVHDLSSMWERRAEARVRCWQVPAAVAAARVRDLFYVYLCLSRRAPMIQDGRP